MRKSDTIPPSSSTANSSSSGEKNDPTSSIKVADEMIEVGDDTLYAAAALLEERIGTPNAITQSSESTLILLPGWKDSLSSFDHEWILRQFFESKKGKPRFKSESIDKIWWHPLPPPMSINQPPVIDRYFAALLLIWMPRKLFQVKITCPRDQCGRELTSAGITKNVRKVLDLESYYYVASECLECTNCKTKFISWSDVIVKQLCLAHQSMLSVLFTYRYAVDYRVVKMMRDRSLENSPRQLQRKLAEFHGKK